MNQRKKGLLALYLALLLALTGCEQVMERTSEMVRDALGEPQPRGKRLNPNLREKPWTKASHSSNSPRGPSPGTISFWTWRSCRPMRAKPGWS
jgi:hypothetical protein